MRAPAPAAVLAAAFAATAAAGCPADPCADDVAPSLELGADDGGAFRALPDEGGVLAVEFGSQGGQHLWAGLRAQGLHPGSPDPTDGLRNDDLPYVTFSLHAEEGTLSPDTLARLPLVDLGEGIYGLDHRQVPFRLYAVYPTDPEPVEERRAALEAMDLVLRVEVQDACGDDLVDERIVRIEFPLPGGEEPG